MAQRKTVTVFFSDVVGSTDLGESLDAEVVRDVIGRYFEESRAVLERHGGTLEKFIGDAVVALFGVPVAREDDALRALRAADEIRARLVDLNDDLERRHGVRLEVRTGVNTGEVVVDDSGADGFRALGDTMNTAARLEQAAGAGEVLIGALTRELGGDALVVESVEPLELKGKSAPVEAFRLLRVLADATPYARRDDAPLVGRLQELRALREAFEHAREQGGAVLVTLVGAAGMGKSRLARELVGALGESAQVLIGRCVAYGEGVTFLPVAEAIAPVLGADPRAAVVGLLREDEHAVSIADNVDALLSGATRGSTEDTFWAVRRVLETLARERPLVLVVDDVHWAEPTLLDLLEYVATFSRGAPILIVATARPDLLEERPTWAAPRENASVLLLRPLTEDESAQLTGHLAATKLDSDEVERVVEAADGNPLFLEQLVALNADSGGELVVPPTIQALLAARIDRLEAGERGVLEAAAVEGRRFRRRALVEVLPESERGAVGVHLLSLARRQYIRPARDAEEETFVFVHGLMRDAAYQAIPKQRRAELHVRLATHLEGTSLAAGEVVGHHLAEAWRYRRELDADAPDVEELAHRGAELLAAGGERALARGDDRAAAKLLDEACELVPIDDPHGRLLRVELGRALAGSGSLDRASAVFESLREAAAAAGEAALEKRAELGLASVRAQTDVGYSMRDLLELAESARPVFEEAGDERGLARAWFLVHWVLFRTGHFDESIDALEPVVVHSRNANDPREQIRALGQIAVATLWGSTRVDEGFEIIDELVERAGNARLMEGFAERVRGGLCSMTGEFELGRERCRRATEIFEELGHPVSAIGVASELQIIERQDGRLDVAEQILRAAYARFVDIGDFGYLSWIAPALAQTLAERGHHQEASELARVCREELQRDHAYAQVASRLADTTVHQHEGDVESALAVALEALARVEQTDMVNLRADTLAVIAELERALGREAEARQRIASALELYEVKGNIVSAARLRERP